MPASHRNVWLLCFGRYECSLLMKYMLEKSGSHISLNRTLECAANTPNIVSTQICDAFNATLYLEHEHKTVLRLQQTIIPLEGLKASLNALHSSQ